MDVDAVTDGLCDLDVGCRWGEGGEGRRGLLGEVPARLSSTDDLVVRAFPVGQWAWMRGSLWSEVRRSGETTGLG